MINREKAPPGFYSVINENDFLTSGHLWDRFLAVASQEDVFVSEPVNSDFIDQVVSLDLSLLPKNIAEIVGLLTKYYLLLPITYDRFDTFFEELPPQIVHEYRRELYKILEIRKDTKLSGNSYKAVQLHLGSIKRIISRLAIDYKARNNLTLTLCKIKLHMCTLCSEFGGYNKLPLEKKIAVTKEIDILLLLLFKQLINTFAPLKRDFSLKKYCHASN